MSRVGSALEIVELWFSVPGFWILIWPALDPVSELGVGLLGRRGGVTGATPDLRMAIIVW